jgi:hypothetical protein
MIHVKVEYDAYNRTFKLLDRDFGNILEDGATYNLTVPFTLCDVSEDDKLIPISKSAARS